MKLIYILIPVISICATSCKTLLPGGGNVSTSEWLSYQQAEQTFAKIIPDITTDKDLELMGINFKTTPNLKKLTYLDIMSKFNLDDSVFSDINLPKGVQAALNKHADCFGYELTLKSHTSKRVGSFWKDILGFQQTTKVRGWDFTGLIIMVDGVVVYVLTSGSPNTEHIKTEKNPLGPFQNINGGEIISIAEDL